jgi:hypothetical protein
MRRPTIDLAKWLGAETRGRRGVRRDRHARVPTLEGCERRLLLAIDTTGRLIDSATITATRNSIANINSIRAGTVSPGPLQVGFGGLDAETYTRPFFTPYPFGLFASSPTAGGEEVSRPVRETRFVAFVITTRSPRDFLAFPPVIP